MNKKYFVILVLLALFIVFLKPMLIYYNYQKGFDLYESKDYESAYSYLKIAFDKDPQNSSYRYYYLHNLLAMPKTPRVQKQLLRVKEFEVSEKEVINEVLKNLQKKYLNDIGSNYIENVTFNRGIIHWHLTSEPLKVYIQKDKNLPFYYSEAVVNALYSWKDVFDKDFSFIVTNKKEDAKIVVSFTNFLYQACSGNDCKTTSGDTQPYFKDDILKYMDVRISLKDDRNNYYDDIQIYNTALHEIGHALGIIGHSFNTEDIMYPFVNMQTKENDYNERKYLSYRDANTLNLLYKIAPDISDIPQKEAFEKDYIIADLVLGSKEQIAQKKLEEAKKYVAEVPDNYVSWSNLATAYSDCGDYGKAKELYAKAFELATDYRSKDYIYYNLAILEYNFENYKEAISVLNLYLSEYGDKSYDARKMLGFCYLQLGKLKSSIEVYEGLIKEDNKDFDSYYFLTKAYVKNKEFKKAKDTLKLAFEYNPALKNTDKFKEFASLKLKF